MPFFESKFTNLSKICLRFCALKCQARHKNFFKFIQDLSLKKATIYKSVLENSNFLPFVKRFRKILNMMKIKFLLLNFKIILS